MVTQQPIDWVLLSYRIPREPSTPRIAVWRKLKELGVAQVGDGLVALPHDARTREHLEWVAARVIEADGQAIVWIASPGRKRDGETLARDMRAERDAEYRELIAEVGEAVEVDGRAVSRWRRQLRRIGRRDYFRAPHRDEARLAIDDVVQRSVDRALS